MELSPRSLLTAGISLTAATAVAFTPLVSAPPRPGISASGVSMPEVTIADVRLAVTSTQIGELAGVPGEALIGVVDTIVRLLDGTFTGLVDATDDPAGAAALTVLKTLSVDAYAKLAENLTLGNAVITSTATVVVDLASDAVTGSLRRLADGELPAAGRLLVGNGLAIAQAMGDAAFEIVRIAIGEVTFQFTNAVTRLGDLLTTLADASGSPPAQTAVTAVQTVALTPARRVFTFGSDVAATTVDVAHTGFDAVMGGARRIVDPPAEPLEPVRPNRAPHSTGSTPVDAATAADSDDVTERTVSKSSPGRVGGNPKERQGAGALTATSTPRDRAGGTGTRATDGPEG